MSGFTDKNLENKNHRFQAQPREVVTCTTTFLFSKNSLACLTAAIKRYRYNWFRHCVSSRVKLFCLRKTEDEITLSAFQWCSNLFRIYNIPKISLDEMKDLVTSFRIMLTGHLPILIYMIYFRVIGFTIRFDCPRAYIGRKNCFLCEFACCSYVKNVV